MLTIDTLIEKTPKRLKDTVKPIFRFFVNKHNAELSFWRKKHKIHDGRFKNTGYKRLMLAVAGEVADSFVEEKIVADFGCGPCGSLTWASSAKLRIGIDVLADRYADEFPGDVISPGMIYLKSTEKIIPIPLDFVDIMFTINAIDHVDNFTIMCKEILRVMKIGGEFIGSFNLEEPPSPTEPQKLSKKDIWENLLCRLEVQSYRITKKGPKNDRYAPFFNESLSYKPNEEGVLWVRARKIG